MPVMYGQSPWRMDVGSIKPVAGLMPASQANLSKMVPFFLSDMDWIGNPTAVERIVGAIIDSVRKGEKWFNVAFGGWEPASNEFGIQPLRPMHLGRTDNRWLWTSGASTSVHWTAADSFITSHTMDTDELIMIYGYFNLEPTPNTLELYFQPGANKWPLWNIEEMRIKNKKYFLLPDPFIIEPRSPLYIEASCRSISTAEECGLLGYMFAPLARLIRKAT
jgi:hypothetical protein